MGDLMEKKLYDKIVMNHMPKETRIQNGVIAFLVGGTVGVLGELLMEFYSYYLKIRKSDASKQNERLKNRHFCCHAPHGACGLKSPAPITVSRSISHAPHGACGLKW